MWSVVYFGNGINLRVSACSLRVRIHRELKIVFVKHWRMNKSTQYKWKENTMQIIHSLSLLPSSFLSVCPLPPHLPITSVVSTQQWHRIYLRTSCWNRNQHTVCGFKCANISESGVFAQLQLKLNFVFVVPRCMHANKFTPISSLMRLRNYTRPFCHTPSKRTHTPKSRGQLTERQRIICTYIGNHTFSSNDTAIVWDFSCRNSYCCCCCCCCIRSVNWLTC